MQSAPAKSGIISIIGLEVVAGPYHNLEVYEQAIYEGLAVFEKSQTLSPEETGARLIQVISGALEDAGPVNSALKDGRLCFYWQ